MHLKQKGVSFELCAEAEAARILAGQDHYFRLAAYRVLFPKKVGGAHDGEYAIRFSAVPCTAKIVM